MEHVTHDVTIRSSTTLLFTRESNPEESIPSLHEVDGFCNVRITPTRSNHELKAGIRRVELMCNRACFAVFEWDSYERCWRLPRGRWDASPNCLWPCMLDSTNVSFRVVVLGKRYESVDVKFSFDAVVFPRENEIQLALSDPRKTTNTSFPAFVTTFADSSREQCTLGGGLNYLLYKDGGVVIRYSGNHG